MTSLLWAGDAMGFGLKRSTVACFGAGVYWGLSLRSLSAWYRVEFESASQWQGFDNPVVVLISVLTQLTIVLTNILATVFSPRFRTMRYVRVFAAIGLTANLVMAFLHVLLTWLGLDDLRWVAMSSMVIRGIGMAGCMLLWGQYFAFLEKRQAGRSVMFVSAIGMVSYFASLVMLPDVGVVFDSLGFALSLVCALVVGPEEKKIPRDFNRQALPSIVGFYLSRAGIGLCLGFSSILLLTNSPASISFPLVAAALLVSGGHGGVW